MTAWLVTGGAGFIGSHLCEALLRRGAVVRVLDDLSSGKRENLPSDIELIEGDVADEAVVRSAMDGVAGCFHLAAIASVERGVSDWLHTHRANLTGAITVFDAGRATRVPVVYASSAAVYGDVATVPIAEDAPCRPLSAYGADKLGGELHARVASRVHRIPTVGLRFFNVYGPRQDPRSPYSGVISIFCERARRAAPIDIFGDGEQTRDFVHVADVVAALLAGDAAGADPCAGVQLMHRSRDLGARTRACHRSPGRRAAGRTPCAATRRRDPSLDRHPRPGARSALGLAGPVPLRDGLAKVLAWLGTVN